MKIAAIGECMIELSERRGDQCRIGFGGDTLNTAIYLARLGAPVDYVTALGDDGYSDRMLAAWRAEGVGTAQVLRLPGRLPGLYAIETDAAGERRFYYWRDQAPARALFSLPQTPGLVAALAGYDLIYLSGISLSLYGEDGRAVLFDALEKARAAGARVAFDTNFRPRGWPVPEIARAAFGRMLALTDIALIGQEDRRLMFDDAEIASCRAWAQAPEIVIKLDKPGCLVIAGETEQPVPAELVAEPVDTTAAGDSFSAGYLAARLRGLDPVRAARIGHRVAATVVRHPGAVIPIAAMPALDWET